MSSEKLGLSELHRELQEAVALIEGNVKQLPRLPQTSGNVIADSESLLSKCEAIVNRKKNTKPTIRVIHHFACSGGTLISKCISALPNVFLLSELQPTSSLHLGDGTPKFSPADVITQARYACIPNIDKLSWEIFVNSIEKVNEHVQGFGGSLVIREHTHSEFCVGAITPERSATIENLEKSFEVRNVITVRNPIDSYLSLKKNGWLHFDPANFEEYCNRLLACLSQFDDRQIIKYEDVVDNPSRNLKKIARELDLPYSKSFVETFSAFKVTGDSGRTGNVIASRERRQLSIEFESEILKSSAFKQICGRLKYEI